MPNKYLSKILGISIPLIFLFNLIFVGNPTFAANDLLVANDYGLGATATEAFGTLPSITAPQFLGRIAGAALAIAGSLFLFLMIYGGVLIMSAAGKPEQVKKGKEVIIWAIIGAIILGAAYAITALVFQAISGSQ